jgi:hypothetical protein
MQAEQTLLLPRFGHYGEFMRTVGVDLSAEARGTGIAVIDWDPGAGRLNEVTVGADDALILAALDNADQAAIDCPFVDSLAAVRMASNCKCVRPSVGDSVGTLGRRT